MEINATQVVKIKVQPQELVNELRKKFGVSDFKMINGKIYHYERVSWDDYDYVKFNGNDDRCSAIKENLGLIDNLVQKLNKYRNTYVDSVVI